MAAALAFGYGIASRDVLANMIAAIYSRNRYREGQVLKLDDVKGLITRIDAISVTIQSAEATVIIPLQHF